MPDITGSLRTPRLSAAPSSPVVGEMYYDTGANKLLWWNGTAWIGATGGVQNPLLSGTPIPVVILPDAGDYHLDCAGRDFVVFQASSSFTTMTHKIFLDNIKTGTPFLISLYSRRQANLAGVTFSFGNSYPNYLPAYEDGNVVNEDLNLPPLNAGQYLSYYGVGGPVDGYLMGQVSISGKPGWWGTNRDYTVSASFTPGPWFTGLIGWANSASTTTLPPTSGFLNDATLNFIQYGTGQITFVPGASVTIRVPTGKIAKTKGRYSQVSALYTGTNEWALSGDLADAVGPLDFKSQQGINVTDPSNPQDAATKAYVDTKVIKTFRSGHTWAIPETLRALGLPPIFVPEAEAQVTTLIGARAKIGGGTSIVAQVQRNGSNLGSPITVSTSAATTAFSQVLSDTDQLGLVLSSLVGAPTDLSFTLLLEHVV